MASTQISTSVASFWRRVDSSENDRCWPWLGARKPTGYGFLSFQRKYWRAHRLAWFLTHGSIPAGQHVLHRCDNPPCCNPAHLWLGTHADNMRDRSAKGRQARKQPSLIAAQKEWAQSHRGERHFNAKLRDADIPFIRARIAAGERFTTIAADYPVSRFTIGLIARRRRYSHIE